jgi:hypothetical protein
MVIPSFMFAPPVLGSVTRLSLISKDLAAYRPVADCGSPGASRRNHLTPHPPRTAPSHLVADKVAGIL